MSINHEFNNNLPPMKYERNGCAAAVMTEGQIFVMGGYNNATAEMYDIATQQWIALQSMSTERCYCTAVSLCDQIVVIGGYDESYSTLSSVEQFDTISRQWSSSFPSMNREREGCAAAVVDGKIIVVGGCDDNYNYLDCVEEYNPSTQKWSEISPMYFKRAYCAAAVLEGQLYVMGGYNGSRRLSSAEVYDPETKRWTLIQGMSTARKYCAAAVLGGKVVVVGGLDGSEILSSCEEYDTTSQQWSRIASTQTKRNGCAAVAVEGTLYVMGGRDGERNYLSSMESLAIHSSPPHAAPTQATERPSKIDHTFSSHLPKTMQLLQEKIPTGNFIPIATEVIPVAETCVSLPLEETTTSLSKNLSNASTEEICSWLSSSNHGISTASLDILRREEIDGIFLFTESYDRIYQSLKEEGMKTGQISRIRYAIEEAKREGSLNKGGKLT